MNGKKKSDRSRPHLKEYANISIIFGMTKRKEVNNA